LTPWFEKYKKLNATEISIVSRPDTKYELTINDPAFKANIF
jgi:hypothetical protein